MRFLLLKCRQNKNEEEIKLLRAQIKLSPFYCLIPALLRRRRKQGAQFVISTYCVIVIAEVVIVLLLFPALSFI